MKTSWVATLNARDYNKDLKPLAICKSIGLSCLFLILSCSQNDDIDAPIINPPIYNESVIVYTDIEPDFLGGDLDELYQLDLNNDGIRDFTFSRGNYDSWGEIYEYLAIGSNMAFQEGIMSITESEYLPPRPIPLDFEYEIYEIGAFNNPYGAGFLEGGFFNIGDCLEEPDCFQDWENKGDKYLALRFRINGKLHYGWARMNIVSLSEWVIKDYAYNATPNMPILAGQKE